MPWVTVLELVGNWLLTKVTKFTLPVSDKQMQHHHWTLPPSVSGVFMLALGGKKLHKSFSRILITWDHVSLNWGVRVAMISLLDTLSILCACFTIQGKLSSLFHLILQQWQWSTWNDLQRVKKLEEFEVNGRIKTIQTTAVKNQWEYFMSFV